MGEHQPVMTSKKSLVAMLIAGVACFGWYMATRSLRELQSNITATQLKPMAALLADNRALILELQNGAFAEPGVGILAAYLAKIRRDGVVKTAEMKQRLDRLAENNTAIVTIFNVYSAHAVLTEVSVEGGKFSKYAIAWRDRWSSVMELFMVGGSFPASETPFPVGFGAAIDAEIAARE
jgi:hypothetical protein